MWVIVHMSCQSYINRQKSWFFSSVGFNKKKKQQWKKLHHIFLFILFHTYNPRWHSVRQRQLAARLLESVLQIFVVASYLEQSPVLSHSKSGCVAGWHQAIAIMANCKSLWRSNRFSQKKEKKKRRNWTVKSKKKKSQVRGRKTSSRSSFSTSGL